MTQITSWLHLLPTEIYDLIFEYVARDKYKNVLLDIGSNVFYVRIFTDARWLHPIHSQCQSEIQCCMQSLCSKLCATIKEKSINTIRLYISLQKWYNYNATFKLLDISTLSKIKYCLKRSKPHIVYIENLNYQELQSLSRFIDLRSYQPLIEQYVCNGDNITKPNLAFYHHYNWWNNNYCDHISNDVAY